MNIAVTDTAEQPLYRQIYDQLSGGILRGEIRGGDALPPIRTVAQELRVSVISVKRAWEELERDGFITTAVGRGSFAAVLTPEELDRKRRALLASRLSPGVAYGRSLGADAEEIGEVLRSLLEKK